MSVIMLQRGTPISAGHELGPTSGTPQGGQQPAQRAEQRAVGPRQRRAWVVSAQHGDLVTEHQDLDILGCVGSGEQRQPAQHAGEHQIGESKSHIERSCWSGFGL
jgi:hypothetical protein